MFGLFFTCSSTANKGVTRCQSSTAVGEGRAPWTNEVHVKVQVFRQADRHEKMYFPRIFRRFCPSRGDEASTILPFESLEKEIDTGRTEKCCGNGS